MIQCRTLGPIEITVDGNPAPPELLWRKHLALLLYLARSPRQARSREHLIGMLWGDRTESAARHSLSEALAGDSPSRGPERSRIGCWPGSTFPRCRGSRCGSARGVVRGGRVGGGLRAGRGRVPRGVLGTGCFRVRGLARRRAGIVAWSRGRGSGAPRRGIVPGGECTTGERCRGTRSYPRPDLGAGITNRAPMSGARR